MELNRFHGALREVRHELRDALRGAISAGAGVVNEALREEDALLRDSLVLLEVERTIVDERLPAGQALLKVLEERRRLRRLVDDGASAAPAFASMECAFRRVARALGGGSEERNFPEARRPKPSAR